MQLPMSGLPPKPEISRTAGSWPEPADDRRYTITVPDATTETETDLTATAIETEIENETETEAITLPAHHHHVRLEEETPTPHLLETILTASTTTVTSAQGEREDGSQIEGLQTVGMTGLGHAMSIQGGDEGAGGVVFRRAEGISTMVEDAGEAAIRSEIGIMEGGEEVGSMTGIIMIDEDLMIGRDRVCTELRILHVKIQMNAVGSTTRLQDLLVVHIHPDGTADRLLLMTASCLEVAIQTTTVMTGDAGVGLPVPVPQNAPCLEMSSPNRCMKKCIFRLPQHTPNARSAPQTEKPATKSASPHVEAELNDGLHLKVESVLEDSRSPASISNAKEEPADQDGDFKMRDRSPGPPSHPPYQTIKTPPTPASPATSFKHPIPEEPSGEMSKPLTAPFLPPFTRRETLKERLGQKYKDDLSQIETIEASRSRAASEQVQNSKAVRRALHELEMTTIDLRAAQMRREHAENHRKKAASANGFFDFEAEFSGSVARAPSTNNP
ncbi:uncharacterized protein EDB93DRAFT_1100911 [Suillus bovinus]|uniref:uncharacterized protein n=1 Tax=Suillus bovinus TaxID=48563 RepID=UPI001B8736F8|nr:uncharacterized protein EDB93DRAFT_1100911 [Suillus bovinus]KAG2158143.1 hypothetical protein EDB93DRAFT_1100911 [Suillus bovinus]